MTEAAQKELDELMTRIADVARVDPAGVLIAVVAELIEHACGTNAELRDFMRLQLYRKIARRLP